MKSLTKEINLINEEIIRFPVLWNGKGWKSSENEKLSIIESGDKRCLFNKILEAIENSMQMICLQSFLIQDSDIIDALIRAVRERSVKVFILSSTDARLKETIVEEDDYIKANYIKLIDSKFKNHFIHRSSESFHGKYILIDPKTNPKGFICTNNFTENGFTKNPELAVELNHFQCDELYKVFVYHFWEHTSDEQTSTNEFAKVKSANKFILPNLEYILLTSPDDKNNTLNKTLTEAVTKSKKSISFSTFQLDKSTELVKAIINKAKQNISVTLFCRPIEKQFEEQLKEILEAGVIIYFHPLIHAKSLLIDKKEGFIFTANFTANGLENGCEVGVMLNENQAKDLSIIHLKWQTDFPNKAIKFSKIKDLKEIHIFKDRKLTPQIIKDEIQQTISKKIVKVSELNSFFNQHFQIKERFTKSMMIKLIAEMEELPAKYKAVGLEKFEVIETKEDNRMNLKMVVINAEFGIEDISKIKEWKELKIYHT